MPQKPVRKARPRRSSLHETGSVNRWDDVADRFLDDKRRQGCSVSTLTSYTYYLTGPRIEVFRSDHGIDIIEDFTADVVATFDAELRDAGLKILA